MGGGGHTKAILEHGGKVIALDQDPDAIQHTSNSLKEYIDCKKLDIVKTNFRYINEAVRKSYFFDGIPIEKRVVDGVLMDLGISSYQIDQQHRGFAFGQDGPLDMRMGKGETHGASQLTAADIVNTWDVTELANCLYDFGDETRSRQIAREIVFARPLNTTADLVKVISKITSFKQRPQTLARCFQALRIAVNDEIGALEDALSSVHEVIKPSGRLVIISYHSLEDRRVKNLFKFGSVDGDTATIKGNVWQPVFKKAQLPTENEILRNKRSRSAKLRVANRIIAGQLDAGASVPKSKSFFGAKQRAKAQRFNEDDHIES